MSIRLREDGVTWQVIGDDAIALDLEGSVYLRLNGSGRLLWERLQQTATEEDLAQALVDEYEIDADRAREDAATFVADLRRRGLLVE